MPYFVYITSNTNRTVLYTGVTNDLVKRIAQHKLKLAEGFTKRYKAERLVYFEVFEDAITAIAREKQIKGGSRQKKIDLVRNVNRKWEDLSMGL